MGRRESNARVRAARITPVQSMREFLSDSSFGMVVPVALLFCFLHQRVIGIETEYGSGGLWCFLGSPAVLCLAISVLLAFFGAKTDMLPAMIPVLGLCGIVASLAMFTVITVRRMGMAGGILGSLQEISMILFCASWIMCALRLILTCIGLDVSPSWGIPAVAATVTALILFVIRAMYIFSSLVTALSRNLLLPDGEMANEIQWVLRSVPAGEEEAVSTYYGRILDSIGIALLLLTCVPLALRFKAFFEEQAILIKNAREIPLPTQRRTVYAGYDEYTEDIPAPQEEENFTLTTEGYYVEKKITDRAKFKRRERSETAEAAEEKNKAPEPVQESQPEEPEEIAGDNSAEYFDDYVPGEGWSSFLKRSGTAEQPVEPSVSDDASAERKRVRPTAASKPALDPNDPDFWNQYRT